MVVGHLIALHLSDYPRGWQDPRKPIPVIIPGTTYPQVSRRRAEMKRATTKVKPKADRPKQIQEIVAKRMLKKERVTADGPNPIRTFHTNTVKDRWGREQAKSPGPNGQEKPPPLKFTRHNLAEKVMENKILTNSQYGHHHYQANNAPDRQDRHKKQTKEQLNPPRKSVILPHLRVRQGRQHQTGHGPNRPLQLLQGQKQELSTQGGRHTIPLSVIA